MMVRQIRRWHLFPDADELICSLHPLIVDLASRAIRERGRFDIVLAGGETPRRLYRSLAGAETGWKNWCVYFSDERCVPTGDARRNDLMARAAWLDRVPIPPERIYSIPAELGPEEGARRYADRLSGQGAFDLVLLGLGEDGHTAGLFPGGGKTLDLSDTVAVFDAPKPPPERVSLSALRLSRAGRVFFMLTGRHKQEAVRRWRADAPIPANNIAPEGGVDIFLDYRAADW
ncbi:MAG TPA: 6-phosphogluconolactonase [Sedimenticola sp.]|nr:6-phosphogluconolactonase [Sedimenticola sp.]